MLKVVSTRSSRHWSQPRSHRCCWTHGIIILFVFEEHIARSLYNKRHLSGTAPWPDPLQAPSLRREELEWHPPPNGVVIDPNGAHMLGEGRTSAGAAFLVELGARRSGTPTVLHTNWLGICSPFIGMLRQDAYTVWPKTAAAYGAYFVRRARKAFC